MTAFAVAVGLSVGQNPPVDGAVDVRKRAGDRLRTLRERLGLSQEALGKAAGGVDKETVNRIELGRNTTIDSIGKLANHFGVTLADLFDEEESDRLRHTGTGVRTDAVRDDADIRSGYVPDSIPVIAEGEATPHGMSWTNTIVRHVVIEYIARPHDVVDPDAYGLLVIGDSMVEKFHKGQRLIASPNEPIEDGDAVYVQLKNGERLIKLGFREENGWRLVSVNPAYAPKFVTDDEVETIHAIVWAKLKKPGRRVIDEQTGKRIRG